jgi:hypothetical protein
MHFEWVSAEVLARIKSVLACGFCLRLVVVSMEGQRGVLARCDGVLVWCGVAWVFGGVCVFVLEEWNEMYESSFTFFHRFMELFPQRSHASFASTRCLYPRGTGV